MRKMCEFNRRRLKVPQRVFALTQRALLSIRNLVLFLAVMLEIGRLSTVKTSIGSRQGGSAQRRYARKIFSGPRKFMRKKAI